MYGLCWIFWFYIKICIEEKKPNIFQTFSIQDWTDTEAQAGKNQEATPCSE